MGDETSNGKVTKLTGNVGRIEGRLESLEGQFKEHRREMREDIKDGFNSLTTTFSGKMDEISEQFDRRLESCSQNHETLIKQAHGRMKGINDRLDKADTRIAAVELGQGKLGNWKHWLLGVGGAVFFLLIVLPPAIKTLVELMGKLFGG